MAVDETSRELLLSVERDGPHTLGARPRVSENAVAAPGKPAPPRRTLAPRHRARRDALVEALEAELSEAAVRGIAADRPSTSACLRRVVNVSPAERFEALYREHYAAVLRFARRRTDHQTAEDVTAETFAIAWRRLDRIPAHKPLPWLYVTAGHELANRRRKAASDRKKATAVPTDVGRDPAEALAERDAVLQAFAALSERDREALRLVAWEGLSLADGARAAGVTRVAFAVRVSRARRRLAAALDDEPSALRPLEIS